MPTLNETKHTPGPWELAYELDGDGDAVRVSRAGHNFDVALVYGHGGDALSDHERNANARLVAAAPDLLSALRAVVEIADRKTVEFDAARAAIAKAEGREP